jgi:transcription elongation factor
MLMYARFKNIFLYSNEQLIHIHIYRSFKREELINIIKTMQNKEKFWKYFSISMVKKKEQ